MSTSHGLTKRDMEKRGMILMLIAGPSYVRLSKTVCTLSCPWWELTETIVWKLVHTGRRADFY